MGVFEIVDKRRGVIDVKRVQSAQAIRQGWGPGVESHLDVREISYELQDAEPSHLSDDYLQKEMKARPGANCYLVKVEREPDSLMQVAHWPDRDEARICWEPKSHEEWDRLLRVAGDSRLLTVPADSIRSAVEETLFKYFKAIFLKKRGTLD